MTAATAPPGTATFPWTLPRQAEQEIPDAVKGELPAEMKRPTVDAILFGPNGAGVAVRLLVDSGCGQSVLSGGLLAGLGISEADCVESQPVDFIGGGSVRRLLYRPGLTGRVAGRWDLRLEGSFALPSEAFTDFDDGLLGREFLKAARVTFDGRTGTTTIEPYLERN